jgi:Tfp pilus assembly protein PilV
MNNKRAYNKNGFILADVMIGMVILLIGIIAIAGLYLQSSKANLFADNRTKADNWAQARMEFLKADPTWKAAGVAPADIDNPLLPGFKMQTTVSPANLLNLPARSDSTTSAVSDATLLAAVNARLIDVMVTVTWNEKSGQQSVSLETLIDHN